MIHVFVKVLSYVSFLIAIPILEKHMDFLISNCTMTAEQGGVNSITWTRSALNGVLLKGLGHLTEVWNMISPPHTRMIHLSRQDQTLWEKIKDWELQQFQSNTIEPQSVKPFAYLSSDPFTEC